MLLVLTQLDLKDKARYITVIRFSRPLIIVLKCGILYIKQNILDKFGTYLLTESNLKMSSIVFLVNYTIN